MGPLLQEAQFACFDDVDDNISSGVSSLPTFVISSPFACSQPPKGATAHASECRASGSFFFQNESLRDRFVCWRVVKNVLLLREWSLHKTLAQNGIRLEFPAPIVSTGVFAGERYKDEQNGSDDAVTINVVTHAATIHRLTYSVPSSQKLSIFSESDMNALPKPKPATSSRCDILKSLNCNETLTAAFWVNVYTVVLGTDAGRVVGVNFGLSGEPNELREFVFSDRSMVSWLWQGLVQSAAIKLTGGLEASRAKQKIGVAVLAVTCFQIDEDDDNTEEDVCVVTISADGVLKAWSFSAQLCIGRQQLQTLVTTESDGYAGEIEEQNWNDEDMISNDGDRSSSTSAYATHAKVIALPPTESDNCRLLVHLDISAAHAPEIYLLRGDVHLTAMSNGGASGSELTLSTARVFTVQPPEQRMKRGLKMVDFAVDKDLLFSSWRSLEGDEVYIHPNPMALTGPKRVLGQLVSSLEVQMQKYEVEDSDWLFDVNREDAVTLIDEFFAERVLLPGRFSRQNLLSAIEEVKNGALGGSSFQSSFDHCLRKYKDVLIHLVSSRCAEAASAAVIYNRSTPNMQRIMIWKELITLCSKYWRGANMPIGFATTTNALLPGAPVMLRRNRVSILFPSAPLITAAFTVQVEQVSTRKDCVAALVSEVLPIFDAFPSQRFQSFIQREVADIAVDQKVESYVALARHCVRLGLDSDMPAIASRIVSADLALTRAILRFSKLLGSDTVFHNQVFRTLVEHYLPPELRHDPGAHKSSLSKHEKNPIIDNDANPVTHKIRSPAANAATPDKDHSTMRQPFFAGHEVCYAFGQVVSHAIDEMCTQTLRVVLLLAYLVDSRPAFLGAATLSKIVQLYLPQSITVYQQWRLSQWVVSQGFTQSVADVEFATTSPAAITPPLLQMFLLDINGGLNGSDNFKRVLSVLQLARASNNVRSEVVHDVLLAFARDILQCVSPSHDTLMRFLQKRQQFRLLRATLCCNLSDTSMHGSWKGTVAHPQHENEVHNLMRSIGECLAFEGREVAARSGNSIDTRGHARSCFQQAIRCYSICLTDILQDRNDCLSLSGKVLEQFIYEVVGLLKESVPRGSIDLLLSFLWTVVSEALSYLAQFDGCEPSFAVQSFIWVNVFKYSLEEQLFRDAHLALMHTAELSAAWNGSKSAEDTGDTASECINYLVKELFRYGHFDLICELHWGSLQPQVETYILWQAGNAAVVQGDSSNASATRYYNLLFAFYMRNQGPASAASALYAFALRSQLTLSTSKAAFEAQRNALNAACNALQELPPENRWFVHKLHTKRPKRSSLNIPGHAKVVPFTRVVTLKDMKRDLSVLDGKLHLLMIGCLEGMLLSTMDGDEVIAFLVDAVNSSCDKIRNTTQAERRRAGLHCIEIAADIAGRSPVATMSSLTKSLARYCASCEHSSISQCDRDLSWELLEVFLANAGSLEQYEVAAETVLDFSLQEGRKLVLPVWLKEQLSTPSLGNPVLLLGLYLKHGLLLEGLELVESLLLDIATTDKKTQQLMSSTHSQSKSSALPFELPWVPYNLVDVLLDSTAAVLSQGVSEDVSPTDVARLREHDRRLRQQLSQHFYSINALQQAQEATSLARSCNALDT